MAVKGTERTCSKGHRFYKSSDCPTCPVCEAARKPDDQFLASLGAPARRALEHANINSAKALSQYTERQIMALHGMGKASIPKLKAWLDSQELDFRPDESAS